jgi:hypothetical protein
VIIFEGKHTTKNKNKKQGIINRTDFVVLMNAYLKDDDADDDELIGSAKQRRPTAAIVGLLSQDSEANQFLLTDLVPSQPPSPNSPFGTGNHFSLPPVSVVRQLSDPAKHTIV